MTTTLKAAGESVARRGFFDGDKDAALVAQFMRLAEEVGELARSWRKGNLDHDELADVAIVCASIAHLEGIDLDAKVAAKCDRDEYERGYRHNGTSSKFASREPVPTNGNRQGCTIVRY